MDFQQTFILYCQYSMYHYHIFMETSNRTKMKPHRDGLLYTFTKYISAQKDDRQLPRELVLEIKEEEMQQTKVESGGLEITFRDGLC